MRVDQKDYPRRPEPIIRPCHGKNEIVLASSGVGAMASSQRAKEFVPRAKAPSRRGRGVAGEMELPGWVGEMEIKTPGVDKLSRWPETIIRLSGRASLL